MKNFAKKSILILILLTIILSACTSPAEPEITPQPAQGSFPFTFSTEDLHENTVSDASLDEPAEPEIASQPAQGSFPFAFSTEDLHGNIVSDASLGEKDLFFVYFWTTWCPACVNSMPGLMDLADEFGDDIGFITLLGDFDTARDTALRITEDAPFYTVDAHDSDLEQLMELVQSGFLPTSVIIDANGNVIGEQIVGGGIARLRTAIEDALGR